MSKILISISIILAIVVFQGCEKTERTTMTKNEKALLDSLYAKSVSGVRKRADSICDAEYQLVFDNAKDSFYQMSVREIRAIFNGEG